jgi:hypothetical protein
MIRDEFPDDLIRHCEQEALEAVAADTAGLVRAVLRASRYADLVAALEQVLAEPLGPNQRHLHDIARAALAAAGHKQERGK